MRRPLTVLDLFARIGPANPDLQIPKSGLVRIWGHESLIEVDFEF